MKSDNVKAYPPAMLERLQADMVTAERSHAPITCPTSGLACEVCDETADAPAITPAIARDLIAEGQAASAEYLARVRRGAEQPDVHAQRLPTPNAHPAIVDLVLTRPLSPAARAVIQARDAIGQARYGTRLQPFNGLDAARDVTEEAADAVNYAMQGIAEAKDDAARARWERRFAMAVVLLEECVGEPVSAADKLPEPDPAPAYEDDWERENRIAGTTEELEQLRAALADARAQLAESERQVSALSDERDVARNALEIAQHSIESLQGQQGNAESLRDRLYIIAHRLGANLPTLGERYAKDAALRIELNVADLQRAHRTIERSRDRWQARARKAEKRVAALTVERDDANQRVARKVAGQVKHRKPRPEQVRAWLREERTTKRKAGTRKGGR